MGAEANPYFPSAQLGPDRNGMPWASMPAGKLPMAQRPALGPPNAAGTTPSSSVPPRIKAVLFDFEDVLYDASAWYRWLGHVFCHLDLKRCEEEFSRRWHEQLLPQVHRGEQDFHAALATCLDNLGFAAAHVEEIVAASRAQRRRQENSLRAFPGVRATLSRLADAGIARAILTNAVRSSAQLQVDLGKLGLERLFDVVLSSFDMGCSLPDKACYQRAASALNLPSQRTAFVSHDLCDLRGAQAAGLTAIAFNARENVGDIVHIDRFEELSALVLCSAEAKSTPVCAV